MKNDQETIRQLQAKLQAALKQNHELETQSEYFRNLCQDIPEALFELDLQGKVTFLNEKGIEFFGYTAADIEKGINGTDLMVKEQKTVARDRISRLAESEKVGWIEYTGVRKDGTTFPLSSNSEPIFKNGKSVGIRGIVIDISEIKQTEQRLRKASEELNIKIEKQTIELARSEEKIHVIGSSALDAIVLMDLAGNVVFWNRAAEKMFGYTVEEMMGKSVHNILMPAHYTPQFQKGFTSFRKTGKGKAVGRILELQAVRKGGFEFPIEIAVAPIPMQGEYGAVATIRDITERKQAQKALIESEEKLRGFMDAASDGFTLWDENLNLVMINKTALRAFPEGTTEQDVLGRNVQELNPTIVESGRYDQYLEVIRTDNPFVFEDYTPGVEFGDALLLVRAFKVGSGLGIIGTDITAARRRSEQALQKSEARLADILDNSITVVFLKDLEGRYLLVNRRYEELFQVTKEEIVGKTDYDVFPREHAEAFQAQDRQALKAGRPIEVEEIVPQDDGLHIYNSVKFPLFDQDGKPYGVCGIATDITEQKSVEEELTKFKTIADNANYGIAIVDLMGTIEYLNEHFARVHGYGPEELVGKSISIFHNEKQLMAVEKINRDLMEQGSYGPMQVDHFHRTGYEFPMLMSGSVIRDDQDNPLYLAATAIDITEMKKVELEKKTLLEQLHQSQKMEALGILAGGIAHDVNNVLQTIFNNVYLSRGELPEDHSVQGQLQGILNASRHAKDLVKHILTFSRTTGGKSQPVAIEPIIRASVEMLRATISKDIQIRQRIQDPDGVVLADSSQIHQIIVNLCTNAVQAMGDQGGVLEIAMTREEVAKPGQKTSWNLAPGSYVHLSIKDSGTGLDEHTASKAFDPFFTTKGVGEGTGLGLSVVHGIVTLLGGKVLLTSELDKGTVIDVFLPRITLTILGNKSKQAPSKKGNETILLVDDEQEQATLGKRLLEVHGYTVEALTDAREALTLLQQSPQRFDLLVVDQMMPGMSGLEMAAETHRINPTMPIILATGKATYEVEQQAKESGIRRVLKKPFSPEELRKTIQQLMGDRKKGDH